MVLGFYCALDWLHCVMDVLNGFIKRFMEHRHDRTSLREGPVVI